MVCSIATERLWGFKFVSFRFVLWRLKIFRFVSFRFVDPQIFFVSFRFVLWGLKIFPFRFVSFIFGQKMTVSFRFRFVSYKRSVPTYKILSKSVARATIERLRPCSIPYLCKLSGMLLGQGRHSLLPPLCHLIPHVFSLQSFLLCQLFSQQFLSVDRLSLDLVSLFLGCRRGVRW